LIKRFDPLARLLWIQADISFVRLHGHESIIITSLANAIGGAKMHTVVPNCAVDSIGLIGSLPDL
jgi:hypothetical protein